MSTSCCKSHFKDLCAFECEIGVVSTFYYPFPLCLMKFDLKRFKSLLEMTSERSRRRLRAFTIRFSLPALESIA